MRRSFAVLAAAVAVAAAGCGNHSERSHAPQSAARPEGYRYAPPPAPFAQVPFSAAPKHIDGGGLTLIERFENVPKTVYCPEPDPAVGWAIPTRGFGETEGIRRSSPCISHAQAQANLQHLIESRYEWAIRGLGVIFNQNQWNALCSFVWNLGAGIFTGSLRTSLQHFNPFPMLAYDHAAGRVLAGLAERRRLEVHLFLTAPPKPRALTARLRRSIQKRILILRRVLLADGCDRRRKQHRHLGAKCSRWVGEGAHLHHELKVNHL